MTFKVSVKTKHKKASVNFTVAELLELTGKLSENIAVSGLDKKKSGKWQFY